MDPVQIERDGLLNNEIGYPSPDHPSDHFSIAYEVILTSNTVKKESNIPEEPDLNNKSIEFLDIEREIELKAQEMVDKMVKERT